MRGVLLGGSHPTLTRTAFPREIMLQGGVGRSHGRSQQVPGVAHVGAEMGTLRTRCPWAQATHMQTGGLSWTNFCPGGARPGGVDAVPSSLHPTRLSHPAPPCSFTQNNDTTYHQHSRAENLTQAAWHTRAHSRHIPQPPVSGPSTQGTHAISPDLRS